MARSAKHTALDGWSASSSAKWRAGLVWTTTGEAVYPAYLLLGRLAAGTYSWRVRAIDEHGVEGAWSAVDEFIITAAKTTPVVTLEPWGPSVTTTPMTTWSVADADGDQQTDYEVEIASDAGFVTIVQDSGVVASTAMYHQHTALAAGTYYRRVRVRTASVEWSSWDTDSITIIAATTQADDWELWYYGGAKYTAYPLKAVSVERRLDGPSSFRFSVPNVGGACGGIAKGDDLVLKLKTAAGKELAFRGVAGAPERGVFATFTCRDIGRLFDYWRVKITRGRSTLADVIRAIVQNPTGEYATGISTFVAELEDPETPGQPIWWDIFEGGGQTVATLLDTYRQCTGCRWYIDVHPATAAWQFHFFAPGRCPDWAVTLRDDISRLAESSTQLRIIEDIVIPGDVIDETNRVRYWARSGGPALPAGIFSWDSLWTESLTGWTVKASTWLLPFMDSDARTPVLSLDSSTYDTGAASIKLTFTQPAGETWWTSLLHLVALDLPDCYRDWSGAAYGGIKARVRATCLKADGTTEEAPLSNICLYAYLYPPGGYPMGLVSAGEILGGVGACQYWAPDGGDTDDVIHSVTRNAWSDATWLFASAKARDLEEDGIKMPSSVTTIDAHSIGRVIFAVDLNSGYRTNTAGGVTKRLTPMAAGSVLTIWLDNLQLVAIPGTKSSVEGYVETDDCRDGLVAPVEAEIADLNLPEAVARAFAKYTLDRAVNGITRYPGIPLSGIHQVPMEVQVPLEITEQGITGVAAPLSSVTWLPLDSGNRTVLELGEPMPNEIRALTSLGYRLERLDAERR